MYMKPPMRFTAVQENSQPLIKAHPLCFRARSLCSLLNRPIQCKDTYYIGNLGFALTGITTPTPSDDEGELEIPDISFIASFAPDNSAIPAILKPDSPEAFALHSLMNKYLIPCQLPQLYDIGYGNIYVKADLQRFAKELKRLDIGYEKLKDGIILIAKPMPEAA